MEKTVFSGIKEKYDNIDKRIKMCILSAFICGLFAQNYDFAQCFIQNIYK